MPDLVIVESPGKTRKINDILGRGFVVRASFGHVRDLPQPPAKRSGGSAGNARPRSRQVSLGLDVDAGWKPTWEIIDTKAKVVRELSGLGRDGTVYLATDLDREGEAIAWHLRELLGGSEERFRRVTFSEITPAAVQAAFERPRGIDYDLVHAQQARRFLDRVVGFTVSPLLSRRLRAGLSAGRVQSAALRILVERDEKIRVFTPAEFFGVDLALSMDDGEPVTAQVVDADGNVARFDHRSDAEALAAHLASVPVTLDDVAIVDASQHPKPPFTTSTLQQAASSLLKLSVSDTMAIAQKLYEGGRITYMRSDAVFVAPEAQAAAREWLTAAFGEGAVPDKAPQYKSKEGAQEAHEAIRPTNPAAGPEELEPDPARVYDLVRRRLLASQMTPARIRRTTWKLSAPGASGAVPVRLVAKGRVVVDPGFLTGCCRRLRRPTSRRRFRTWRPVRCGRRGARRRQVSSSWTKPQPRYTEASLVAELESAGVGRPSTYANTLKTLVDRAYVLLDGRVFVVTPLGRLVCARLSRHFPKVTDVGFTAALEKSLDEVAAGRARMHGLLDAFYGELKGELAGAEQDAEFVPPEADPGRVAVSVVRPGLRGAHRARPARACLPHVPGSGGAELGAEEGETACGALGVGREGGFRAGGGGPADAGALPGMRRRAAALEDVGRRLPASVRGLAGLRGCGGRGGPCGPNARQGAGAEAPCLMSRLVTVPVSAARGPTGPVLACWLALRELNRPCRGRTGWRTSPL